MFRACENVFAFLFQPWWLFSQFRFQGMAPRQQAPPRAPRQAPPQAPQRALILHQLLPLVSLGEKRLEVVLQTSLETCGVVPEQ